MENKSFGIDELVIIFDGTVELYTPMDSGTELIIEHLSKGSIINANSFMLERMSKALEHKLAIALKKIMKSESQYSKTHLVFKTPDAIPCLEQLMT